MQYSETVEIITILRKAYPKFIQATKLDPDIEVLMKSTTQLWHGFLSNYPAEQCRAAVMAHIAECKFPPTISEIRDRIQNDTPRLSTSMSEWERKSQDRLMAWYEQNKREHHEQGKLTAVECKNRGMSYADYCAQFDNE